MRVFLVLFFLLAINIASPSSTVQGRQQETPSLPGGIPESPRTGEELQPADVWRDSQVSW